MFPAQPFLGSARLHAFGPPTEFPGRAFFHFLLLYRNLLCAVHGQR